MCSAGKEAKQPGVAHVYDSPGHEGAGVVHVHPPKHPPGSALLQQVAENTEEALELPTQGLLHVSLGRVHWVEYR